MDIKCPTLPLEEEVQKWQSRINREYLKRGFNVVFLHARGSITPFQRPISLYDPLLSDTVSLYMQELTQFKDKLLYIEFSDLFEYLFKLKSNQKGVVRGFIMFMGTTE